MIIYVYFIIFDGIVLSSSQPIKISIITEPESLDLGITTNLNSSEHYVSRNLSETNSKSRRYKKSFLCHHNQVKRSLSEKSMKIDSSTLTTETNSKSRRLKRLLVSDHSHARRSFSKNVSGRSTNVDSSDAVKANSRRSKRSSLSHHSHGGRRSLPVKSTKVVSSNVTDANSKSTRSKRSSLSHHSHAKRGLAGRSIKVNSRTTTNAESKRPKRSLFHGRRGLSEHSPGRSMEQRRAEDGDKRHQKKDGTALRRGKRGSMFPQQPYDGNILLTVQLFLLFIPLASASAVVLGVVAPWSSEDDDSSTWDCAAGDYARAKDDAADEFVLNRIKGADPLAKRLKLERVLGHQCPCLYDPEAPVAAEAPTPAEATRRRYYAGLVTVVGLIAFFVYKIVLIVS